MAITLQMPARLEARVREEAAREGIDPGTLVVRALEKQLTAQPGGDAQLPEQELLRLINEGPSDAVWTRYRELAARRDAETLTPAEHEELIRLSDAIEAADVRRLEWMAQLARFRGISLSQLRAELDIPQPSTGRGNA